MKSFRIFFAAATLVFILNSAVSAWAQGAVVKQDSWTFGPEVLTGVEGGNPGVADPVKRADFFLNVSKEKLLAAAQAQGKKASADHATLYLQGQMFRGDMEAAAPRGKMTIIVRKDTGMMYYISWDEKKYVEMPLEQIKQMRADMQKSMKDMPNMPEMEKALEKLPPAMREQALQAMKASGQMPSSPPTKKEFKKTGKTQVINGMSCEEYVVHGANEASSYWVTKVNPRLAKMFQDFATEMKQSFGLEDQKTSGEEIWEIAPGAAPIVTRELHASTTSRASLNIQETVSVEEKDIPLNTFEVPKEGLTATTMQEMMMNMGKGKRSQK